MPASPRTARTAAACEDQIASGFFLFYPAGMRIYPRAARAEQCETACRRRASIRRAPRRFLDRVRGSRSCSSIKRASWRGRGRVCDRFGSRDRTSRPRWGRDEMVSAMRMEDSQRCRLGPRACADAGEHAARTRRPLRRRELDGTAVDVRLNLTPERATSAAAAETHTSDRNSQSANSVKVSRKL